MTLKNGRSAAAYRGEDSPGVGKSRCVSLPDSVNGSVLWLSNLRVHKRL